MMLTRCLLATLLVAVMATASQAQVSVSGSQVRDEFNYSAGPLNGLIGADERNVFGGFGGATGTPLSTWVSTGDATTPGEAFVVREENLVFGPQETLFDAPVLGSIGRSPQIGTGGATRRIGKESSDADQNTNIQKNVINKGRESFTQLTMVWNGGKVGFSLSNREFNLSTLAIKLLSDPAGTPETPVGESFSGFGFTIEADGIDPNIGILKSTVFKTFSNGSAGNTSDAGAGIQLTKGDTYQVFIQAEMGDSTNDEVISVFAVSETDVVNPETTLYLADLPATSKSEVTEGFGNSAMKEALQFAVYATQNFEADNLRIGFLSGDVTGTIGDDVARDPARQALVAFRTEHQKIAWKSSLGDPYLPGDTRLDGVVLGSATNANVSSNDINHLYGQILQGNTSTVSYYDLDASGVIDSDDVVFLVETIFGSTMGDVDLDGTKDATDQAIVAANIGGSDTSWSDGDINGDNAVDGLDLAFFIVLPGDFNGDFVVDAADYTVWRDNLGATEDGSVLNGKGNGGIVDQDDYIVWASTFGTSLPQSVSIPEPSSVALLLVLGCASFTAVRPRRAS